MGFLAVGVTPVLAPNDHSKVGPQQFSVIDTECHGPFFLETFDQLLFVFVLFDRKVHLPGMPDSTDPQI